MDSEQLYARALRSIPGGVNSPVRAWNAVGGTPRFIASASGAMITDVEGRTYIDYVGSWGPMILGHAPEKIVRRIEEAARRGTSFGAPTAGELQLAERLCSLFPSLDKLRLVSSGTEATMSAVRLARAATGRARIVKFAGCYHGSHDAVLVRAGSGAMTLGVPDSPGVPREIASLTGIATYNDVDSARHLCTNDTAAILVEPVAGNMGVVPPQPGFLEDLRQLADDCGALLLFDEVITGLRLSPGGYQKLVGVEPDLTCLGKIIGGGLPVGAYGGRAELMDQVAPAGTVYQAGTLSGNPLAVAAGLAMLDELSAEGTYEKLETLTASLESGICRLLKGRRACVQRVGSMLTVFFGVQRVCNYDDALVTDTDRFARFFHALLERGIWIPPSQFESWFISTAHSQEQIEQTIAAVARALEVSE